MCSAINFGYYCRQVDLLAGGESVSAGNPNRAPYRASFHRAGLGLPCWRLLHGAHATASAPEPEGLTPSDIPFARRKQQASPLDPGLQQDCSIGAITPTAPCRQHKRTEKIAARNHCTDQRKKVPLINQALAAFTVEVPAADCRADSTCPGFRRKILIRGGRAAPLIYPHPGWPHA